MSAPSVTALDLITGAMRLCQALEAGETPSAEDAQDGLLSLNDLIDDLGTQRLTIYATARTQVTLTSGVASYTIGSGGVFDIVRPLWIPFAGIVLDVSAVPPTEMPIDVYTVQQYANTAIKALQSGLPQAIYYDHMWSGGLGNIYPLPIPNVSNVALAIYTPTALTAFADLSTAYTFPPGYARMLRYNLAVELAPEFGRPPDGVVLAKAQDSLANVKRMNANQVLTEARVDTALTRKSSIWNWRTGSPITGI